jgi:hypothetical protein
MPAMRKKIHNVRSAHRKVMPHVIQSELKTYYIRS